ncbi:MAG: polyprenyl synthetase family protein [Bacteroidales bacterium]|nr:polyprenyl synthetase family protein [Bacteroidales bacterium]
MTIEQIKQPILKEYQLFLEEYRKYTNNDVPLLSEVVEYLSHFPGKQLRPILVLLSAQACGVMHPHHTRLAAAVEMLHNASLMHDDVVDESDSRRKHDSVRHRWSNQVAVLCGDYFLSVVMTLLKDVKNYDAWELLNKTVRTMCKGELMQLASINSQIKENSYLEIIGAKTASLMATCCQLGACTFSESDHDYSQQMRDFGYHYGLVFQIRDDMGDFNASHDVALPISTDPLQLIDQHVALAQEAIRPLPDSPAKQVLLAMLQPSAPQPE